MLGKAAPRMQCACFVTIASVDAAPTEQIASFFYENGISFNDADSSSFAHDTGWPRWIWGYDKPTDFPNHLKLRK